LAQQAFAEQALGRWVDAEVHLAAALAAEQDPWIQTNAAALRDALSAIQQRLGSLHVAANVAGAQLFVDGVAVGTLPLEKPLRLTAGTYTIELKHTGYYPMSRRLSIDAGGTARETLTLQSIPPEQPPPPGGAAGAPAASGPRASGAAPARDKATHGPTRYGTLKWAAVATSGALAVTAGVFWALREKQVARYNDDATCPGAAAANQPGHCDDRLSKGKAYGVVSGVGLAGAIVSGVAAGTLFALDGPQSQQLGASPRFGITWQETF
jgi:hypothetical protein